MKIKTNPTLHDETHITNLRPTDNAPVRHVFKLGLDVDLNNVVTAIQCERGAIALPQKFSRARLVQWVREKVAAGHAVHTVYEACGFGYTLHEQLTSAGAHSIITTPLQL